MKLRELKWNDTGQKCWTCSGWWTRLEDFSCLEKPSHKILTYNFDAYPHKWSSNLLFFPWCFNIVLLKNVLKFHLQILEKNYQWSIGSLLCLVFQHPISQFPLTKLYIWYVFWGVKSRAFPTLDTCTIHPFIKFSLIWPEHFPSSVMVSPSTP